MQTITLTLPRPHSGRTMGGQRRIMAEARRYNVLCCGRRFGKTDLGEIVISKAILEGKPAGWFAPTYKILDDAWQEIKRIYHPIITRSNDTEMVIEFVTGARLEGWSLDKEGAGISRKYAVIVVDEAARVKNLMRSFSENIRPTLTDYKGAGWFFSTPKGFNDFYELYKFSDKYPDWKSFQASTYENPYIDPAEINAAKMQLPELAFRQEYLAEFVQMAGALFRREYFQYTENIPVIQQSRHWDLAASTKTQADYSVGCRGGMDSNGNVYVTDVVRGRWEWPALIRIIRDVALSDGPAVMQSIETAGTQKGLLDLLMAEPMLSGIAFRGVVPVQDKITRAQPVLARAEQNKLYLLRANWNAELIDEMLAFPEVDHDDQVDAVSGMMASCAQIGWSW